MYADRIWIAALMLMNFAAILFQIRFHVISAESFKITALSASLTILLYLPASVPLLWADHFTVLGAMIVESILILGCCLAHLYFWRVRKTICPGKIKMDAGSKWIVLGLVFLALIMSGERFGLYGMGQDEGVYQTKAVNMIYGISDNVYRFDEYDKLQTEAEKDSYADGIRNNFVGLYLTEESRDAELALSGSTRFDVAYGETDGIFHGIPTYPALLALWGSVFGLKYMTGIQALCFLLSGVLIYATCQNLGLKRSASFLAGILFIMSPEVIWVSKSALTEGPLALIMATFLFLLFSENRRNRWMASLMVICFSALHLSIYALFPMFLVLFQLLYLKTEEKQYILAACLCCVGFMMGLAFMRNIAPYYVWYNVQIICEGTIISYRIVYGMFMCMGGIGMAVSLLMLKIRAHGNVEGWFHSKAFFWICRGFLIVMMAWSVFTIIQQYGKNSDLLLSINQSSLYCMGWMMGVLSLPLILIAVFVRPERYTGTDEGLALLFVFFYAVVFFGCALQNRVSYCYYYGRYLSPYLPVACVMAAVVWNGFSGNQIIAALLGSMIAVLPFDETLWHQKDDTWIGYETITALTDEIDSGNHAVIISEDKARVLLLPCKAMTGCDCYFMTGDLEKQAATLAEQYDQVYVITDSCDWEEVISLDDTYSLDDNISERTGYSPFPCAFTVEGTIHYGLYRYDPIR